MDLARHTFESAVATESRRLFAVAVSITRDPAEAEDAVQETMVKAWRKWDTVRDESRRSAWLTRICVNHCISRKRGKLAAWLLRDPHAPERADEPVAVLDTRDPDLDRACALLTAHQRAVVTLHYHYGYSLDECADLLDCRPGTVRSHLHRALEALRKELSHG